MKETGTADRAAVESYRHRRPTARSQFHVSRRWAETSRSATWRGEQTVDKDIHSRAHFVSPSAGFERANCRKVRGSGERCAVLCTFSRGVVKRQAPFGVRSHDLVGIEPRRRRTGRADLRRETICGFSLFSRRTGKNAKQDDCRSAPCRHRGRPRDEHISHGPDSPENPAHSIGQIERLLRADIDVGRIH
jgi:hypothetical protein